MSARARAQARDSCISETDRKRLYLRTGSQESGSFVSPSASNTSDCRCSLFSESTSTGAGEGGSCVSASSHKIEGTIFGLQDDLARRENGMGLRDAAGVSPPADKCTPGFSPQCLISPQECCGVQEFMTMTPPLGSGSSVAAPQRLLPRMDLVATNPRTPVDLSTIRQFIKNSESRKDLIQELLSDSTVHR